MSGNNGASGPGHSLLSTFHSSLSYAATPITTQLAWPLAPAFTFRKQDPAGTSEVRTGAIGHSGSGFSKFKTGNRRPCLRASKLATSSIAPEPAPALPVKLLAATTGTRSA